MESDFTISNILDIIEISKKYEKGRKRKRDRIEYNRDLEKLRECTKPLKKLNDLIGMEDIKKNIIDQVLFYAQRLNTDEMMHVCLTGPPGVGKTTVGKILAELFCSMGFLKTNNFKVATRADFIGGYLGQTALKTKKLLTDSLDGVLFWDESYSISNGKDDSDSYAKECIDTINQFLSEHTKNFIMIICGYEEELERCFFNMNPGLRRRFPWRYNIKEYSSKNLKNIFLYQVKESGWSFDDTFDLGQLDIIFTDKNTFKHNGGDCLILFDKAKICHSRRVFGHQEMKKKHLNNLDMSNAFEMLKRHKELVIKKDAVPYGMYV